MKIFLSGQQERDFVISTLEELREEFNMDYICGSAYSPCMKYVVPWAEANDIKMSLHLPASEEEEDIMISNVSIISQENPRIALIYDESEDMVTHLESECIASPSVEIFLRKPV